MFRWGNIFLSSHKLTIRITQNGQKTVIDKLKFFLKVHTLFTEECEVIYLMVQIRKILNDGGIPHRTLRFYCNWALHNKLDQETTTSLLSDKLEPEINRKKSGHENARNLILYNSDFFKLNTLKDDLELFINENAIPTDLMDNKNWWGFAKLLLEIIKDCHVYFVPTEISELEIVKYDARNFGYKFTLTNNRQKPVIKLKLKSK